MAMAMASILSFCFLLILLAADNSLTDATMETYIVHVQHPEGKTFAHDQDVETWHRSFLPDTTYDVSDMNLRMVYSYRTVMSGFAARLTSEEVSSMREKAGFVSARPQKILKRLTTHSPSFLGLHQELGFWRSSSFGKGVIIGVIDSGVFPNHPSFMDIGMPPPPAKWKGRCEFNGSLCNNKLIGARSFNLGAMAASESPIDEDGHGTHTASTAAGSFVKEAGALGNAEGTAVGVAPGAHVAVYKVCFGEDCADADILAGLDAAVDDGVDVLSISIGGFSIPFFNDTLAIGAFAAIQKGIFVSCSAGNSGPFNSSVVNEAPWILTVGASSIDRNIVATAKLGNGAEYDGESLFQPDFPSTLRPLMYAGMNGKQESAVCAEGSLKDLDVKGKVVLCERGGGVARIAKGEEVKNAGGYAMILANQEIDGFSTLVDAHVLPATHLSSSSGDKIKAYINSTRYPTATIIFKGTMIGNPTAPAVTSFSSRGPSQATPGILKPDIIGPGVSILAAWPFPLDNNTDSKPTFNIISGTSMSCPHLSGVAALLKSSHPDWSPAAIKSAIMTTADQENVAKNPILDERQVSADVFAVGAGHVNPTKASDPGLVYDIEANDYIPYLCGLGYSDDNVGIIVHKPIKCSQVSSIPEGQLNYPSFTVALGPPQTFTRTVTNVGEANSSYIVTVVPPQGASVTVKPSKIYFLEMYQKATYSVTFSSDGSGLGSSKNTQGYLKWKSGRYSVRSPISIRFE